MIFKNCSADKVGQTVVLAIPDAKWIAEHVHQRRYSLQIVKCKSGSCCEPFLMDWLNVLLDLYTPIPSYLEVEIRVIWAGCSRAISIINFKNLNYSNFWERNLYLFIRCQIHFRDKNQVLALKFFVIDFLWFRHFSGKKNKQKTSEYYESDIT